MHSPVARMTARSRALWLVLVLCLWVHPLLLQVHEASNHACDRDHAHAPTPETTATVTGSSQDTASSPCSTHTAGPADGNGCVASGAPHQAADSAELVSASPAEARGDHGPGHHCFHCVLCYAAAHAAQSAPLPVALEIPLETLANVEAGEIHGSRAASIAPAAPRAPPLLS